MPSVEYEELYAVLIALFAALAVCVGGWDVSAISEKQEQNRGMTS